MAFAKYAASWKIILEQMTGNVVISEADASIYVELSKTETRVFMSRSTKETVFVITEVGCRLYVYIYIYIYMCVCVCVCVCVYVCEMTI